MLLAEGQETSSGLANKVAETIGQVDECIYVFETLPPAIRQVREPVRSPRQRTANCTRGLACAAQVYGFDQRGLGDFVEDAVSVRNRHTMAASKASKAIVDG